MDDRSSFQDVSLSEHRLTDYSIKRLHNPEDDVKMTPGTKQGCEASDDVSATFEHGSEMDVSDDDNQNIDVSSAEGKIVSLKAPCLQNVSLTMQYITIKNSHWYSINFLQLIENFLSL